jgi:hypothetical protein
MIARRSLLLIRRRGGTSAWTPSSVSSGSAPPQGISGQEALSMTYRPLPPAQTVEHEEDFGGSLIIQREFVSQRSMKSFDTAALAFSETELQRGRQRLADILNRERRQSPDERNAVSLETSIDDDTREVRSARYLFNEARMAYCERFVAQLRGRLFPADVPDTATTPQPLFSLMEACAIVHGCDDLDAVEGYMSIFLSLDKHTIEEEEEMARAAQANSAPGAADNADADDAEANEGDGLTEAAVALPAEFAEYSSVYNAYVAHCRGQSPIAPVDLSAVTPLGATLERRRWRELILRLSREEFRELTEVDVVDAKNLNDQLHTLKFMDLKVGDVVREIAARRRFHDKSAPASNMAVLPKDQSPGNPDLRRRQ